VVNEEYIRGEFTRGVQIQGARQDRSPLMMKTTNNSVMWGR
jgi:hypothetical protein